MGSHPAWTLGLFWTGGVGDRIKSWRCRDTYDRSSGARRQGFQSVWIFDVGWSFCQRIRCLYHCLFYVDRLEPQENNDFPFLSKGWTSLGCPNGYYLSTVGSTLSICFSIYVHVYTLRIVYPVCVYLNICVRCVYATYAWICAYVLNVYVYICDHWRAHVIWPSCRTLAIIAHILLHPWNWFLAIQFGIDLSNLL